MVTTADVAEFQKQLKEKEARLERVEFELAQVGHKITQNERRALYLGMDLAVTELKKLAARSREGKLGQMKKFIEGFENIELWWNQFCSLWTAYCFQNDMSPDTANYDTDLREVWLAMPENVRGDFEDFDLFMSRYLA